jgi:hypothetical protein
LEPVDGTSTDPVDRLILNLRSYLHRPTRRGDPPHRKWTSGISVTFDTETTTDPSQRLRFGIYQVRDRGVLIERGLFYAPDVPADDLAVLRATFSEIERTDAGERLRLRTRDDFIEGIIYGWGYDVGGLIVGFNLPFDLSRIATGHTYAKGAMKGGFSFTLANGRPNVRIKHLSQRAAFIDFAGKDGFDQAPDKGFFVDVKTLAAALTSQSHSLESLTKLLGVTPKMPLDSYDGPLTPEMVRYGLNDVQATWECFDALAARYHAYDLQADLSDLYSEASLGKAFLAAMNIEPWRQAQPDFPPEVIGQIMSTYFGGRAEVHIRREIVPVIHCDFLSMYPTVCTLMGLWRFVIADGMTFTDATDEVRRLVDRCTLDDLQDPNTWRALACIVQVRPDGDIFPVRATYPGDQSSTIGLNHLTADEPLWFTLADVLASKVLSGKSPQIVSALRFEAGAPQAGLHAIKLAGVDVRPAHDDFYKLLIDQRRRVQAREKLATGDEKATLHSDQQSLKILANSTSYGIFVEINVQHLDAARAFDLYDHRGVCRKIRTKKVERPGRFFHPLLGTLITGAARLMLALAERQAIDQGLDWAFCDTDSLAIANTAGLEADDFTRRVRKVCAWFELLNPYEVKGSIFQLEKVNFPAGRDGELDKLRPVNCLAISSKRYGLFDRDETGTPVIRKASAHGLGYLVAPYRDDDRGARIGRIGVELWQEDLWRAIIAAFDAGAPDEVDFASLPNFDEPAASRYAATNQKLLSWFGKYNEAVDPSDRVWPFNFLLTFQAKSKMEMAVVDPDALATAAWTRRMPFPASRYSSDLINDRPPVFDRKTGAPVPWHWLKSNRRALVRHHMHSEAKFLGGYQDDRGPLRRRNVQAWAIIAIGKEADDLEEREAVGVTGDETIERPFAQRYRAKLEAEIDEVSAIHSISDAALLRAAGVSHHTLTALRAGGRVSQHSLLRLAQAAEAFKAEAEPIAEEHAHWRQVGIELMAKVGGRNKLAKIMGVSAPYLGRVFKGEKPMTEAIVAKLKSSSAQASHRRV